VGIGIVLDVMKCRCLHIARRFERSEWFTVHSQTLAFSFTAYPWISNLSYSDL